MCLLLNVSLSGHVCPLTSGIGFNQSSRTLSFHRYHSQSVLFCICRWVLDSSAWYCGELPSLGKIISLYCSVSIVNMGDSFSLRGLFLYCWVISLDSSLYCLFVIVIVVHIYDFLAPVCFFNWSCFLPLPSIVIRIHNKDCFCFNFTFSDPFHYFFSLRAELLHALFHNNTNMGL